MSMLLMVKAMQTKVGNPLRKLVLIKLADNANDNGECWPSHQHVADQCEISKTSVRNHIKKLESMRLLRIEHREGPKGNSSNLYHLTLQGIAGNDIGISADDTAPIARDDTRTSHSLEPVKEPNNIDLAFDIFWSAGMKKLAKPKALTSFKKALKDSRFKDPISFANHLANDIAIRKESGQFGFDKMHPTTYLNQQRWSDEHETSKQGNAGGGLSAAQAAIAAARQERDSTQSGSPMGSNERVIHGQVDQEEWRGRIIDMDGSDSQPNS